MSEQTDRIAAELMQRYKLQWFDEDQKAWVDEDDPSSLSRTLEVIMGPEPWRSVLGFRPGDHPALAMIHSKALTLRKEAAGDPRAIERIVTALDDAIREVNAEFGSVP